MLLLKNAEVYNPKYIGKKDILIDKDKIIKIANEIEEECQILNCSDKIICPTFIDGHEHITFKQYYNPIDIINSGVSTCVGVLANEQEENQMQILLNTANNLKENYNVNTYVLAGSKNCTYNIEKYIINYENVVGIKTALYSEFRPKPNLSYEKLKNDTIKVYNAGIKSNKNVQVHIHLDNPFPINGSANIEEINSGKIDNLNWLDMIVKETGIPYSIFKLTHAQKYYNRIIEYANKGVYIDYTAFDDKYDKRYDYLVEAIKKRKIDLSKISISSDLGILSTEKNYIKKESPITLLKTIRTLIIEKGLTFEQVIPFITTNALAPIKQEKILIKEGIKPNFILLDKDFNIYKIIKNENLNLNIKKEDYFFNIFYVI